MGGAWLPSFAAVLNRAGAVWWPISQPQTVGEAAGSHLHAQTSNSKHQQVNRNKRKDLFVSTVSAGPDQGQGERQKGQRWSEALTPLRLPGPHLSLPWVTPVQSVLPDNVAGLC